MGRKVAFYAHDAGSGHMRHAATIARHPDLEVLVMSSRQPRASDQFRYAALPSDIVDAYEAPVDGPFHYTPTVAPVRARFRALHDALNQWQPEVVVVDVSVEVIAFAKLCGYPVIARRMHGNRTDRAHRTMYDAADGMLAYYGEPFEDRAYLDAYGAKTTFAGMLDPHIAARSSASNEVLVLTSLGGTGVDLADVATAARQTPSWKWTVAGHGSGVGDAPNLDVLGVVDDVDRLLSRATVVIASAGHNAVRAAVGSRRPLLLMPEQRPHDEQQYFADALAAYGNAELVSSWNQDWGALLTEASRQDPNRLADALLVDDRSFFDAISSAIDVALA